MERRTDVRIDRRAVGLILPVTAIERGAKFRHPVVLDGSPDVPGRRQLEAGCGGRKGVGEISIVNPGKPDTATPLSAPEQVGLPSARVVETAFAVADAILALHCKGIALRPAPIRQVQLKPAADPIAPLVGGMSGGVDDTPPGTR